MCCRVVTNHIGLLDGSPLQKINNAIERYRIDFSIDYNNIRERIRELDVEYHSTIGRLVKTAKHRLQELRTRSVEFTELIAYKNASEETINMSKDQILKTLHFVKAELKEFTLIRDEDFAASKWTKKDACDKDHIPCRLYLPRERREVCEKMLDGYVESLDDTLTLENVTILSDEDWDALKLFTERTVHRLEDITDCFGNYYHVIAESIDALDRVHPDLFVSEIRERLVRTASTSELRLMYAPLYQDQRQIEEVINSYARGTFTKQQVVKQLSRGLMTEVVARIDRYRFKKHIKTEEENIFFLPQTNKQKSGNKVCDPKEKKTYNVAGFCIETRFVHKVQASTSLPILPCTTRGGGNTLMGGIIHRE